LPQETNSNFGFNLPWWDRLFGTYRVAPAAGHDGARRGRWSFHTAKTPSGHWRLSFDHLVRDGKQPWRGLTGARGTSAIAVRYGRSEAL
jgi:hypothetical protein